MKHFLNLLVLFAAVNYCQAQKVRPALNLTRGNTYYMISSATSAMVQSLNGQENKINLTIAASMAFKVLDKADTVYKMEVSYQWLNMKIQMADNTIDIDSKKTDPNDIPSSIIAAMVNKPFNISLTKTGKVLAVENIEKMISGIFDGFPQIDTAKKQQIKTQFMQSFGPAAFKGSIETATAIFPNGPVAKNDRWTVNTKLESPAKATVRMSYQLTDILNDLYQIHGEGTMATDKDAKPMQINGLSISYNLTGTTIADIKADKATGWLKEVKLKQAMKGDMQIPDGPTVPGGMTIPMTFATDVLTSDK